MQVIHSSKSILNVLADIKRLLNNERFAPLYVSNEVEIFNINSSIDLVEKRIKSSNYEQILFTDSAPLLRRLHHRWLIFQQENDNNITDEIKVRYKELLHETMNFLLYIKGLPDSSFPQRRDCDGMDDIRTKNSEEEKIRLEQLQKRLAELQQLYEHFRTELPFNQEKTKQLKERLETLNEEVMESKRIIRDIRIDADEEKRIIGRIDNAFAELKTVNNLDEELARLKIEYSIWFGAICIVVVAFLILYSWFLWNIKELQLVKWSDYMPYTMSVPIMIGLLWLFVYLKNRANKISIEMSSQLYDIHYIEGLLKLISSISRSSSDAMNDIERVVNTIVGSFLEKIKFRNLEEKKLCNIEKKELENGPYWKVIQDLKDILKIIKK